MRGRTASTRATFCGSVFASFLTTTSKAPESTTYISLASSSPWVQMRSPSATSILPISEIACATWTELSFSKSRLRLSASAMNCTSYSSMFDGCTFARIEPRRRFVSDETATRPRLRPDVSSAFTHSQ